MKELNAFQNTIYRIGAILMLVGLVCWLSPIRWSAIVIFCVGTLLFGSMQLLQSYQGNNFTIRRLRRQQILGCIILMLTGVIMIVQEIRLGYLYHNEWIVALSIGTLLECYTSFRIPYEIKKENE